MKQIFDYRLPQPKLMDMTRKGDTGVVRITTALHKFSPDAAESGTDPKNAPIFGSIASKNDKKISEVTFGLPFFRFKRGGRPELTFINDTGFSFDLHWHGLNTTADIDGSSLQVEFGRDTKLGIKLLLPFPEIKNNSSLLWVHANPMFLASAFVYTGVYGLLEIVDDQTEFMQEAFTYSDNHIMLIYQDLDLNSTGTLTSVNLYGDEARSCFGVINGISCINWYSDTGPYVTSLYHKSCNNLVKIDILNGTDSFRYIHLGVCDRADKIKPFFYIQSSNGLRNPTSLTMLTIGPANRASILVNLDDFCDKKAYIFLYNFDLTEVSPVTLEDGLLFAEVPDLETNPNPTPNPTPIPGDETPLIYPQVPKITTVNELLTNGNKIPPQVLHQDFSIKKFLKIILAKDNACETDQKEIIKKIKKVVFGEKNYYKYKEIINQHNFEYNDLAINYIALLNDKYFYNLPDIKNAPVRNFILFTDNGENSAASSGGNPRGSTEYIDEQNRIFADLWDSDQLDLAFAISQYNLNVNEYKPTVLPGCKFKIYPTNTKYINYDMLSNDTLKIQFYDQSIFYGDNVTHDIGVVNIKFPSTVEKEMPLDVDEWIASVNVEFRRTDVIIGGELTNLGEILHLDWTFFPFKYQYVTGETGYIKSVMMVINNTSPFNIRFTARWALLQFFGKPLGTKTEGMSAAPMDFPNNYNMNIQQIIPTYATTNPVVPKTTTDDEAELIINANLIYYGFLDGFQNDPFLNFTVKKDSSELWVYHNIAQQDSHPLNFHLTSGFVDAHSKVNSRHLVSSENDYSAYIYSNDTYGIGPQQTIGFYLKFINYSSEETAIKVDPPLKYLGYMYDSRYMTRHDMNMMGNYFVKN
ncbi:MAG: multicopper oxidase [Hyperionvirus sp.]|uniref:Multicopper oxidase n=1 Tax=Hyperionvirus sp. TaxID=2487770 RepID=A0A3G5A9G4_9VIRU|nr:MAG: multicopper oxidase [Hyperionvirus sp.]